MAALSATVDPDGLDDYTALQTGNATEAQDLTDGGGDTFTFTCRSSSGTADTTNVDFTAWDTAAASYILVEAANGDEVLKTSYDATRYRLEDTDAHPLRNQENYFRANGLQIKHTYVGTANRHGLNIVFIAGGGSDIRVTNCRIQAATHADSNAVGLRVSDTDAAVTFENNIIEGGDVAGILVNAAAGSKVYNNVVYGSTLAGIELDTTATVKNNAVSATTTDIQDDAGDSTVDYNASDDGTGTNAQTIIAIGNEFANAAGGDFTAQTGGVIEDNGVGPDTDAAVPTPDIDGTTRAGAACYIGPDELVAAGGNAPTGALQGPLGGPLAGVF